MGKLKSSENYRYKKISVKDWHSQGQKWYGPTEAGKRLEVSRIHRTTQKNILISQITVIENSDANLELGQYGYESNGRQV